MTTSACGATHPSVIGRCGRDAGHDGPHRSTGDTFQASWMDTSPYARRLCEPEPPPLRPDPDLIDNIEGNRKIRDADRAAAQAYCDALDRDGDQA